MAIDEGRFTRILRRLDAVGPGETVILIVPHSANTSDIVGRLCVSLTERGRVSKIIADVSGPA